MRIRVSVPDEHANPHVINAALEAVTRLDESMIRSGQSPTSHQLVASGAKWRPEPPGDEHFDHGGTIKARGWGDCDDWAPLHAATLRASGEDPGAKAIVVPSGPDTYHAIVQRTDGSLDDPSIAAGMKPIRSGKVGGDDGETLQIVACDPHDGRVYSGSLLPVTSPLSIHCGPTFAVRSVGGGVFQARCDLPINGSPLVHVRSYWRGRHHGKRRVHGAVPYAISVTADGGHPRDALNAAIVGCVCCGDAAELNTSEDRMRLVALQSALAGMPAHEIEQALLSLLTQSGMPTHVAQGKAAEYVRNAATACRRFISGGRRVVGQGMPGQGFPAAGMPAY